MMTFKAGHDEERHILEGEKKALTFTKIHNTNVQLKVLDPLSRITLLLEIYMLLGHAEAKRCKR